MSRRHIHIPINIPQSVAQVESPGADCPTDVDLWLHSRGWLSHTDACGEVYTLRDTVYSLTWEQAVAYEFYRFASLGGVPNGEG